MERSAELRGERGWVESARLRLSSQLEVTSYFRPPGALAVGGEDQRPEAEAQG